MVRLTPSSLGTAATAVAYDETHTRLAVADQAGRVTVWERGWESAGWELASTFPLPQGVSSSRSQPLHLCWAPPEFGSVLCSSGADGTVCVWEQQPAQAPPPATAEAAELGAGSQPNGTAHGDGQASGVEAGGVWQLCARLQASSLSVQALAFAPGQPRPLLAAACADGYVRCVLWALWQPPTLLVGGHIHCKRAGLVGQGQGHLLATWGGKGGRDLPASGQSLCAPSSAQRRWTAHDLSA